MSGVRLRVRIAFEVTYDPIADWDPEWYEGRDVDWLVSEQLRVIASEPDSWMGDHLSFDFAGEKMPGAPATCPAGGIAVNVEPAVIPARARTGAVVHLARRTKPDTACGRRHVDDLPEYYVYSLCGQRDLEPLPIEYEASCRGCVRKARGDDDSLIRGWWTQMAIRS